MLTQLISLSRSYSAYTISGEFTLSGGLGPWNKTAEVVPKS